MQAATYNGVAVMGIKMGRGKVLQGLESQIIRSSDFFPVDSVEVLADFIS